MNSHSNVYGIQLVCDNNGTSARARESLCEKLIDF